ncbi:MAG: hypothetical protein IH598_00865 [Bacteroidales bacterium]|nr:hypothetical protein [Bacteroidales bacterium]
MRNRFHFYALFTALMIAGSVTGQIYNPTFYPADSNAAVFYLNRLDFQSPLRLNSYDTSLVDFQAYNWLDSRIPFYATLGNSGLAYRDLDFNVSRPTGFSYGINTFDAYLFQQEEIKYYLNPKPFTELDVVLGASKEQMLNVRHQQKVFRKLSVGVDFEHINSLGTYQRQKSNNRRVAFKAKYFTDNLKYGVIANYTNNKVIVQESGGIVYDSVYEMNLEPDRSIIDIRLRDAQNTIRKAGVYLQQYYQISAKKEMPKQDSGYIPDERFRLRLGRLSHSFNYEKNAMVYSDLNPQSGYYQNIYVDSVNTYDSVYFQKIEIAFAWSNADYIDRMKPQPLLVLFGIKHQLSKVVDSLVNQSFTHLTPHGEIRFTPHPLFNLEGNASLILSDDEYQGDFSIIGLAQLEILRKKTYRTTFNFGFETANHAAPYFYLHYFSNHFAWDNNFSKTLSNKLSAFITQDKLKLGVDISTINNHLYIGADTLPAQYGSSVEVFKAYFEKGERVGKFDLIGRAVYQKSSQEDIIRLPEFMAYLTMTFNLKLVKGALDTRSGFDLRYNSPYFADGYMPALRAFYLQNERETGGFIHADFFINFKVKRTRFFLKAQNILSIIVQEYDYYAVPHYPMQDFGIKFGLDWRFHD